MAIDKILQKIKIQIGELSGTMESFVDETIQPSAADCDNLRRQMNDLLENLAVYKYQKLNNELSPSFNIHAKVSEMAATEKQPIKHVEPIVKNEIKIEPEQPVQVKVEVKNTKQPLLIGINDKFRFINELFSQNSSEYNIVYEQLTTLQSWSETEVYLNSLKNVYGWKDDNEVVKYFYSILKKRFS